MPPMPKIHFDPVINLGHLLTVGALAVSAITFFVTIGNRVTEVEKVVPVVGILQREVAVNQVSIRNQQDLIAQQQRLNEKISATLSDIRESVARIEGRDGQR